MDLGTAAGDSVETQSHGNVTPDWHGGSKGALVGFHPLVLSRVTNPNPWTVWYVVFLLLWYGVPYLSWATLFHWSTRYGQSFMAYLQ